MALICVFVTVTAFSQFQEILQEYENKVFDTKRGTVYFAKEECILTLEELKTRKKNCARGLRAYRWPVMMFSDYAQHLIKYGKVLITA